MVKELQSRLQGTERKDAGTQLIGTARSIGHRKASSLVCWTVLSSALLFPTGELLAEGGDTGAQTTQPRPDVDQASSDTDLEQIFQAFVESQKLDDALRTAELALAQGLPLTLWAPRLAQVAQWNEQPDKALRVWVQYARATDDIQTWKTVQALALQLKDDSAHLQALIRLSALEPGNPDHVLALAALQYRRGNASAALETLDKGEALFEGEKRAAAYWRLYGEIASAAGQREPADRAYRRLLASGQADARDFHTMAAFYEPYPLDAARLTETEFRLNGSADALENALRLYSAASATASVESLLQSLGPEQEQLLERSPGVLLARADYFLAQAQFAPALDDLRRAVQLPNATDQARIVYLWTLVDFGTERELREVMRIFSARASDSPDYWSVYGAAALRIGDTAAAVMYLRRQHLYRGDDPLWTMALADAEQAAGHEGRASRLRDEAWRSLLKNRHEFGAATPTLQLKTASEDEGHPKGRSEQQAAHILLSQSRMNADYARALILALLKQDRQAQQQQATASSILGNAPALPPIEGTLPKHHAEEALLVGPSARRVVLAWAMSGEQLALAKAWLATQYADELLRPTDVQLSLALSENDDEKLKHLLQQTNRNLSVDNRIQALVRTRQIAEAQTVAYDAAQGALNSDARHEVFAGTMAMTGNRPVVGSDFVYADTEPLQTAETSLIGAIKLTQRYGLGIEAVDRAQRSTDSDQLDNVPAHDRQVSAVLTDDTPERNISVRIGRRQAWESFYVASLRIELRPRTDIKVTADFGLNQFTNLSQALQVGASKDRILLSTQWTPGNHWFTYGTAEYAKFHAQDRTSLGHGTNVVASAGYRFSGDLDQWAVRAVGAFGNYSSSGHTVDSLRGLIPLGVSIESSAFMPDDFTQYGLVLSYGNNDKNPYAKRWNPFLEAGYLHDSNQGWGPSVHVGAGGPILGRDQLRFFYLYAATPQGGGQRVRQVGLSYRWYF